MYATVPIVVPGLVRWSVSTPSVDDPFRVCGVERIGNVNRNLEQSIQFHRPPRNCVLQRFAFQNSMPMNALPASSPMS